jgi:hypothetical protein
MRARRWIVSGRAIRALGAWQLPEVLHQHQVAGLRVALRVDERALVG